MEIEEGECIGDSSCSSDEDEQNSAHTALSEEEQDSREANGALLTALQQQIESE